RLRRGARLRRNRQRQAHDALQLPPSFVPRAHRRRCSRGVERARRRSGDGVDDRGMRAPCRLWAGGTAMRVRIWNAYASNNSGSYTIVGWLPSEEVAREVAEELKTMIEAHTAWGEAGRGQADGSDSPLAQFCRTHGLSWRAGMGGYEDWPQYS